MRRWMLRVGVGAGALLLTVIIAVQIVLWTNVPRNIVLGQLQRQLGLQVSAGSLSTGWLGNTELRDVRLSLPLDDQAFLDVPKLRVSHTSLPMLLMRRPIVLESIEVQNPNLVVQRDAAGRWNLSQVAELLTRTGGKQPAAQASPAAPTLPAISITQATVQVIDQNRAPLNIENVTMTGTPDGPLVWTYALKIPGHVDVTGQLAPGGTWQHQLQGAVTNIDQWIKPWAGGIPANTTFAGRWEGRIDDGRLNGLLNLKQFQMGSLTAAGALALRDAGDGAIVAEPRKLLIDTHTKPIQQATLVSGRLTADGRSLKAERVFLSTSEGEARVDGIYNIPTSAGELHAQWTDIVLAGAGVTKLGGNVDLTFDTPLADRPRVKSTVTTRGQTPDGPWTSVLNVTGASRGGWGEMDWTVAAHDFEWQGNYPLSLDGMVAQLATTQSKNGPVIKLIDLHQPGRLAEASGQFELGTSKWNAFAMVGGISLPKTGGARADFTATAWGDRDWIRIKEFFVQGEEGELWADGWYVYAKPQPMDVDVFFKHSPKPVTGADHPPLFGKARGELHIAGTVQTPRNLGVKGKLIADNFRLYDRPIGNIVALIDGTIDNHTAKIHSKKLHVLEGEWNVDATYSAGNKDVTIVADAKGIAVDELARVMKLENFNGSFDANWTIKLPHADAKRVGINGEVRAKQVVVAGQHADTLTARMSGSNGNIRIDNIRLEKTVSRPGAPTPPVASIESSEQLAAAVLPVSRDVQRSAPGMSITKGVIDASLRVDARNPKQLIASVAAKQWPVKVGTQAWLDVSGTFKELFIDADEPTGGGGDLRIAPGLTVNGSGEWSADVIWRDRPLGKASAAMSFMGRDVEVTRIKVESLGGNLEGVATVSADQPLQSTIDLKWENVDGELIADMFPVATGLSGRYSGAFEVAPTSGRRALGPMAVELEITAENGRYIATDIAGLHINGYTDLRRFVLADPVNSPSTINIAGGTLGLWGRLSSHDLGGSSRDIYSTQMTVNFNDLNLDQLVHTGAPEADPMPGLLHGSFTLVGSTAPTRGLTGQNAAQQFIERLTRRTTAQGEVRITNSNLKNVDAIEQLYNLLNIGQNMNEPTGDGEVTIRLENGAMYLDNLRYFNRGTEVRAMARIDEIWKMPDSAISGTAVGSARPLAGLKLPFMADVDEILAVAQPDLTTIAIDGTVRKPTIRTMALSDVGDAMEAFIVGDIHRKR